MKQPLISIIVPVYNAAAYLALCIDSILSQSYSRYELVLVDDGSQDESLTICEDYAKQDDRIRVIHQENGGLSKARNTGLDNCHGEYVTFLDSDDMLDSYFLERMLFVLQKYHAQWVQCGALFGTDRKLNGLRDAKEYVYNGKEALLHNNIKVRVCGCLFSSMLFTKFRFPDRRIYEDEATYYKLIYDCETAVKIDDELYYYFFNKDSLSKKDSNWINDSFIEIFNDRLIYFQDKQDVKMIIKTKERFCRSLMVLYVRCKKNSNNENDTNGYLKLIRQLTKDTMKSNVVSFKSKVQSVCFSLFPRITTFFSIKLKLNSRFM